MTQLQQQFDHMTEELQNKLLWKDVLLVMWDMGLFGAFAGVLGLLLRLFWMATELDFDESDSSGDESSSSSEHEEEARVNEWDLGRFLMQQMQLPELHLANRCQLVEALVGDLLRACHLISWKTVLPRLQACIGVGSTFEGWSSRGDTVYSLLVPLKPPTGLSFHLELGTGGQVPARDGPGPRAGGSGCWATHCYLDVEKTAHWLHLIVMNAWLLLPASHHCQLTVLPSSRSCKLHLENTAGNSLAIDMLLGVQQGDSAVFLTSQEAEAGLSSSTTWLESCAVAEMLFFRFVARHVPRDSCHLTCLQLFAHLLEATALSPYCLKTVLMHLLTVTALSGWHRRDLLQRLDDILHYLHRCLEEKQLHHFLLGNERVPGEVSLPPAFQTASPLNLFQYLAQQPDAHAQALQQFRELQDRLRSLLR
nr:PREDICTED: inositol 1,4,5-trisphosphate receptor-interacting protein-like 1 [Struthio camelus australis]